MVQLQVEVKLIWTFRPHNVIIEHLSSFLKLNNMTFHCANKRKPNYLIFFNFLVCSNNTKTYTPIGQF